MTQKIQLAVQGGGAKISLLLAAMEAIEELQDQRVLEVTRIAGTSAGSIVGCLFAAGVPMRTVRDRLRDGLGEELMRTYRAPKLRNVLHQAAPLFGGSPFWDEGHLKDLLARFFENPNLKLNELKVPVYVIAADISDLKAVTHKDEDNVITAIANSCGLPYCFRTWSRGGGTILVDGGICENLPSEVLQKNADQFGPIAAISFEQQVSHAPKDVIGFTKALLDTAINNSITRAKGALPENSVYTIKTTLSTFDFQKALTVGLNEEYRAVRAEASAWFKKFVERKRNERLGLSGNPWADPNPAAVEMMKNLGLVYDAQHAPVKFKYKKCSFEVRANCLLEKGFKGAAHYRSPDWFKYELEFEPIDKPIECVSIAINPTKDAEFLGVTKGEVWGAGGAITPITAPAFNPNDQDRELMLFFNPILEPGTGGYHLRFQDEGMQLMKPLLTDKTDELAFYPRRVAGTIDRIDLILYVPEELKDSVKMVAKNQAVQGRAMTAAELTAYGPAPSFHTLGWTGQNIAVEDNFGVDLIYQK